MRQLSGLLIALMTPFFAVLDLVSKLTGRGGSRLPKTLRLYRRDDQGMAYFWICERDGHIHIDVGELGHPADSGDYAAENWPRIRDHVEDLREQGFDEISAHDMKFLQIVHSVAGEVADADELAKRRALTERVDALLANTGQGYWIDATTGQGTMETGFLVVDFDIARATIIADLDGSEFADYREIRNFAPAALAEPEDEIETEDDLVIDDGADAVHRALPSDPDSDDDALFDKFDHFGELQPAR